MQLGLDAECWMLGIIPQWTSKIRVPLTRTNPNLHKRGARFPLHKCRRTSVRHGTVRGLEVGRASGLDMRAMSRLAFEVLKGGR